MFPIRGILSPIHQNWTPDAKLSSHAETAADTALAKAAAKNPQTNERRTGQPKPPPAAEQPSNVVVPKAELAAATTIRLRPSAAEPLNAAWLDERRRNDPKLSYPEFASRIVSLGLAAYEEQKTS